MDGVGIFLAAWLICDTYLFSKGYKSHFHNRKTDDEKEIQKLLMDKYRREAGIDPKTKTETGD